MNIVNTLWGPELIVDTKICVDCKEVKPISEFSNRSLRKDGTAETKNICKACGSVQQRFLNRARKSVPKPSSDYVCPCCSKTKEEILSVFGGLQGHTSATKKTIWTLDHDHKNFKVREYICLYCNDTLSRSGDSPETLRGCAKYLEKHCN